MSRTTELGGSRVLVVGGAGFVGCNLVRRAARRGRGQVTVVDNLLSAERGDVPTIARVSFLEGSIADDARPRRASTTASTTSSTWPRSTATRTRSPSRCPTTRTTR